MRSALSARRRLWGRVSGNLSQPCSSSPSSSSSSSPPLLLLLFSSSSPPPPLFLLRFSFSSSSAPPILLTLPSCARTCVHYDDLRGSRMDSFRANPSHSRDSLHSSSLTRTPAARGLDPSPSYFKVSTTFK